MIRAGVLATVATLTALALSAGGVAAQGEGQVVGRLANGTAGGPAPAGVSVALHVISPTSEVNTVTAITDAQGRFTMPVEAANGDASYVLAVVYQGVDYGLSIDWPPAAPVELTVYEITTDPDALHVDSVALLLALAEEEEQTMTGSEVLNLVNSGDRTFVADLSSAAAGSMNFLRFSLPAHAQGLRIESDLSGGEIINVGPGFALTAPVPPGTHLVGFSYNVPYQERTLQFERTAHFETKRFSLLVADSLGEFDGSSLVPGQSVVIGESEYQEWKAGPLSAGQKLDILLTGLPQLPWHQRLSDVALHGTYPKAVLLSLLGLVLGGLLLYVLATSWRSGLPVLEPSPAPTVPIQAGQRQAVLERLAALDEAAERGELPDHEYRRRRAVLKAQAMGHMIGSAGTQEGSVT